MIGIMMMTHNKREGQILKMAFEQLNAKVIISSPSYANYVKSLQYKPDVTIIEFPPLNTAEVQFVQLIRKNKKTKKIPVIGYGNAIPNGMKISLTKAGVGNYMTRPLKFSLLMQTIQKYLELVNKSISNFPAKETGEKEEDIALILAPDTLPLKKVELMVKHISGLMAFPFTVAKVLKLADSDKAGANDLAKVIEADPVISTNILKVSNTVFFASANRRINSVKDAIIRIGFTETKKITMAMGVMDSVGGETNSFGFDRMKFWLHSLSTGIIAEKFASRIPGVSSNEAFLAGLLHDFGIILLDEFFPSIFEKVLDSTTNNAGRFIAHERKLLTISHNDVVKELFEGWKLPKSISSAINSHYSIFTTDKKISEDSDKISACVEFGNILSKCMHSGEGTDQYITPIENDIFNLAKMPTGPNNDFYEDIKSDIAMYMKFLKIEDDDSNSNEFSKSIGVFSIGTRLFNPFELYLLSQGHEVTKIKPADNYSEYDQKFDMICVFAEKDMTIDQLDPFKNLIQKPEECTDAAENTKLAPLLVFIYEDSSMIESASNSEISFMFNKTDLRNVDLAITSIFEGNPVKLGEKPEVEEVPPENSAPEIKENSTEEKVVSA